MSLIFFLDRDWWAWNGWAAVAAFGSILAGGATLGTLWFFWQQLKGVREQARKDFELTHTPLVSIVVDGLDSLDSNKPDELAISFRIDAAGEGPAYNIGVNAFRPDMPGQIIAQPVIIPYLHAPDSQDGKIIWPDRELVAWTDPKRGRLINIEVVFTNIFGRPTRFRHTCRLNPRGSSHLTDAPTYYDLAGRPIRLGE